MPVFVAIIAYLVLFLSGTALSRILPETTSVASVSPTQTPTGGSNTDSTYVVTKVIDGDTITVAMDNGAKTIRLIGIDTPESVDPRKPVQCFALEASRKAKELMEGKRVTLESDPTQGDADKYNRLLRYVSVEGISINKQLLEEGYAHEYTYQNNPYKYQLLYREAQREAREAGRGLWAADACLTIPPGASVVPTIYIPPPIKSEAKDSGSGEFICNCSKSCDAMASCQEAYYQLTTCGCTSRDGDGDGVPCESLCR